MKSSLGMLVLLLAVLGNVVTPVLAAGNPAKPAQTAHLADLKKQLAATDTQIATLKAKQAKSDKQAAQALRDKAKDQKDSVSEMTDQDMLQLQRAMEQKAQLETMISNVMKAASDTSSSTARALKD
jgi:hypothetical protein